MACLNPLRAYFLVKCPRLNPSDGNTVRGFAWTSPEETVVVYKFIGCLYSDVAKTTMSNFRPVETAFSGESPKPGPFCSSAATLARFFHVEVF